MVDVDTLRLAGLAALTFAGYWALSTHWTIDRKVIEIGIVLVALALAFLVRRRSAAGDTAD